MAIAKTPKPKKPSGPAIDKWMPEYPGNNKTPKTPIHRGTKKQPTKKV